MSKEFVHFGEAMLSGAIPNNHESAYIVGQGLKVLQAGDRVVFVPGTIFMHCKAPRQIIERSIVGLPFPRGFDFYIKIAPTLTVATEVSLQQVTLIQKHHLHLPTSNFSSSLDQ